MQISIKIQLQFVLEYVMVPMIMLILCASALYTVPTAGILSFILYHYHLMWAANFSFIHAMAEQKKSATSYNPRVV